MTRQHKLTVPAGPSTRVEPALRQQAEAFLREKVVQSPETEVDLSPEAARQTLHDLRVHQIELEMQNEELRRAYAELDAVRTRYFDLYDLAPVGYCTLSESGLILEANLTATTLLGTTRSALIEQRIAHFILKEDQDLYYRHRKQLFATGAPQTCELRMVKKDGMIFWAHLEAIAAQDEHGASVCRVTLNDITERKQAESKFQLTASVFACAREGIMITDPDGTILEVNDAFTRITGYSRDETLGRNPCLLSSGLHDRPFFAVLWRALLEKGHWYGEIWDRRKDGETYAAMLTISAVRDAQGCTQQYVALFSDITVLKTHEQQLEHIAHYDLLTTLPNRVLLADRLQQALAQAQRRSQPVAVALLDLDGFKAINDRYGHEVGDQLLMTVAARMKQALREGDTLARLGGDEFVAVLPDLADSQASVPWLLRLLAAAAAPMLIGDLTLQVSASIGVTFYPQVDEVDADQLLRQADQAMYQAKLAGKNCYHLFDVQQDCELCSHHEGLERIHSALIEHELVLYYQPKVNLRTGTFIGAEALIRWQHPEQGLLLPAAFLPLIEDHPLAVEIGEWVIETALSQMETWQAVGLDIPVSINIGARQLQQSNFIQRLVARLAMHPAVEPSRLELEVLETSALEDLAQVSQVIAACRGMGVKFALDDFGTGYSSLTYLTRLEVALLKIDQSFVRNMLDDPEDLDILEGVISLAAAFRRQVIAEGVETVAHGELLLQFGCELAQGYGIARPMPAADLPGWLATWRPDPRWLHRPAVSRDDLPILFVGIEHRAWIAAFETFLKGVRETPPPLSEHACRFGAWLEAKVLAGYGAQPALAAIATLHQQMHARAAELLELHSQGRKPEALARLDELHALRDQLLAQLAGFLQSLQQLVSERSQLRALIQAIPDLIWLKDLNGVYLACNRIFERFFGAREADIIGKTDYDFIAAELADFFRQKDREALAADGPTLNEEWITFADDGHRALMQTIKTPMRDTEGKLIGVLGIGRDITALRQAEIARQQLEQQYQMLFREMLDGFALHELIRDAQGQPINYRFVAVNPAFERLTGLKAEILIGKTVLEVLPGTERYWIDIYGRVALTGEPALFENYAQDLGRYFKVTAFRSAPGQFACIFSDITERRQAEMALRTSLEEKTALLKEVHHRVKNNLQIITSLLNLQARQVQNPIALAALQDTQNRIRSMAVLHESLYRGGHPGWVDGSAYLSHLCAHLSNSFGLSTSRVQLRYQLAPVALGLEQAVPCGLIVNELVSNAVKHAFPGERGGEIRVNLTIEPDGRRALVVADDGVGLPPGLDYRQSDTLGLQLVAGLAQQLGATVDTPAAVGAIFRLVFPAYLPSESSPP